ncbi:MAG: CpsB/CapC family capsule biosynthesis tyrosine phosphatase [Thermoleophilaceae bacterium]
MLKPTGRGKGMGTVEEMRSERHLHGVLRALPPDEPLLVQEKLSGPLGSLGVLRPCAARLLLPIAWQSAVTNGAAGSPNSYRIGVTYRWLEGDVVAAIQGTPDTLRRRCVPPKVGDMWARDDPMASVVYGSPDPREARRATRAEAGPSPAQAMIDLHSHVLPGIDDGPEDMTGSIALARAAERDGVQTLAATPHLRADHPRVRLGELAERCEELNARLAEASVGLRVVAGGGRRALGAGGLRR